MCASKEMWAERVLKLHLCAQKKISRNWRETELGPGSGLAQYTFIKSLRSVFIHLSK